jgi:hypothetical protein
VERSAREQVYLLRLWRESEATSWRASLMTTATGARRAFGSLDSLYAFLGALTEPVDRAGRPPSEPIDQAGRPPSEPIDRAGQPPSEPIDRAGQPPSEPIDRAGQPPSESDDGRRP